MENSVRVKGEQGTRVEASSNTASVTCFLWNLGQISQSFPHASSTFLLNTICVSNSESYMGDFTCHSSLPVTYCQEKRDGEMVAQPVKMLTPNLTILSSVLWIHVAKGEKANPRSAWTLWYTCTHTTHCTPYAYIHTLTHMHIHHTLYFFGIHVHTHTRASCPIV